MIAAKCGKLIFKYHVPLMLLFLSNGNFYSRYVQVALRYFYEIGSFSQAAFIYDLTLSIDIKKSIEKNIELRKSRYICVHKRNKML